MPAIRTIEQSDLPEIIDMQARVWQDYFLREKNQNVPMMRRSEQNMNYYLDKEPEGCFLAVDKGETVGSIISHVWGSVGWFGPLEVDQRHQGKGLGKALVGRSVEYLRSRGCKTIGCETMAGSPRNIGFYNKLGFKTRGISNVMHKRLGRFQPDEMEQNPATELESPETGFPWEGIQPGLDYRGEFQSLFSHGLGKAWKLGRGHAMVHTYGMFDDSANAIVKMLVSEDARTASKLLERCEMEAVLAGKAGMFVRTYDPTPPAMGWFFGQGYALQSNSIRLILEGADESTDLVHISSWSG